VAQDYSTLPGPAATVMAHQIGHNFGFEHDDELTGPCSCDDPSGKCIMYSDLRLVLFDNNNNVGYLSICDQGTSGNVIV